MQVPRRELNHRLAIRKSSPPLTFFFIRKFHLPKAACSMTSSLLLIVSLVASNVTHNLSTRVKTNRDGPWEVDLERFAVSWKSERRRKSVAFVRGRRSLRVPEAGCTRNPKLPAARERHVCCLSAAFPTRGKCSHLFSLCSACRRSSVQTSPSEATASPRSSRRLVLAKAMPRVSGFLFVFLVATIVVADAKPTMYKRNQDNVFEPGESVRGCNLLLATPLLGNSCSLGAAN